MKVYYAHPISLYNTPTEARDIETLLSLGLGVFNPNSKELDERYKVEGMAMFEALVKSCDGLAFRAFPEGQISAGVGKEIQWAQEAGLPIIELPVMLLGRTQTIGETREYLQNCGAR